MHVVFGAVNNLNVYQTSARAWPAWLAYRINQTSARAWPTWLAYRIARNFCGDLNLANWQIFFTKLQKLIPPNTRAPACVIVRNRVMCGAHVFAKLIFANSINFFQTNLPTTGYTVAEKQARKKWNEESMVAVAVEMNKMSITAATAATFDVPRKTLDDRVKGRVKHGVKPGPNTVFTLEKGNAFVLYLVHMANCGFPLTCTMVKAFAWAIRLARW